VREISATEAARGFSDLLDDIEHRGQSFVVIRGGHPVARLEPVAIVDGKALKALLAKHKPDRAWLKELADMRESLVVEERSWPA
jgi:antitoxin (DNA-binding transcriptional repressor) of toxin-antitoxin stability system